jgi:hypothetical protein
MFSFGMPFEQYKSSANYWATFFHAKVTYESILAKNGLGYIFGGFLQTYLVTPV